MPMKLAISSGDLSLENLIKNWGKVLLEIQFYEAKVCPEQCKKKSGVRIYQLKNITEALFHC